MRISIAMATYNGAKFLQEQLDSFLCQTRQPHELVVCDDVSSDSTIEILEAFRLQAPFAVHIYSNEENLGYTKNFEKVLSLCTGDIIFLSDQDDVWFKNKLEVIEKVFLEHPDALVAINDQVITDGDLNPTPFTILDNIRAAGLPDSWFITGCCTSFKRAWLNIVLPFPENIGSHDGWVGGLATALELRVVHPEPLQFYRRHGSNTSASAASSQTGFTQLEYYRAFGLKDARNGWKSEIESLDNCIVRLTKIHTETDVATLKAASKKAVLDLQKKIIALNQRIDIVSKSRLYRLPSVVTFYLRGGYVPFAGWKSAVKDMVRP